MDDVNKLPGFIDAQDESIFGAPLDANAREEARWKMLAQKGPFAVKADACKVWPGNTRDTNALSSPSFAELKASLLTVGQMVPVIARISTHRPDTLEIIAGACRWAAINEINEGRDDAEQMRIVVELRDLDNEEALKIVDAENRGRSEMSPLEKARFYDRAIPGVYATEAMLADALGLNKSTVNRTLAIVRLPLVVLDLIKDHHAISAAQASGFLSDWNTPELRDTLENTISELAGQGQSSAATVFKALSQAVSSSMDEAAAAIVHNDVELGSLRYGKSGVTMKLTSAAREVALKPLVICIGNALKEVGFE